MDLMTEDQLRSILKEKVRGRTLTAAAKDIGISLPMLSMLMNNYPMTGKAVTYLGFRKVRQRLYEPIGTSRKRKAKS